MNNSAIINGKYTFGFKILDLCIEETTKETWEKVYALFLKYTCGYEVYSYGVGSAKNNLSFEEMIFIRDRVYILLHCSVGILSVFQDGIFIKKVMIYHSTSYDEICTSIISRSTS